MKRFLSGIALFALVTAINGCGPTVKVSSDYDRAADFSQYKTFTITEDKGKFRNELNATRVVNAIKDNMQKKGFTEGGENADLLINPMTILKEKTQVTANTYGYGGYYRPYGYWGAGMGNTTTTFNTDTYTDGSLIIDVVNKKDNKLLWQGVGNAEIDKAPDNPDKFINDAVTKILAAFPPKGGKK